MGGAGIKDLKVMNQALLGKWIWRLGSESGNPWNRIIKGKYGTTKNGWWTTNGALVNASSIWKGILKMKRIVINNITYVLGNGERFRFWLDTWLGSQPVKDKFPLIFSLSPVTDILVANCCTFTEGKVVWNITCRRNLNDWEIEEYLEMMLFIRASFPVPSATDTIIWNLEKSSIFSVRSLYNLLINRNSANATVNLSPHFCWKYPVPPEFSAFAWIVCKKKILIVDNLRKRGLSLKSQELTAIFLAARLYCSFVMENDIHTFLDFATLISTLWVIYMIRFKLKGSYIEELDNMPIYYMVVPSAVLALIIHPWTSHFILHRILWAFCVYLESVSVLPQLRMMQNAKMVEPFTSHYVFALGVARFLGCAHWIIQVIDTRGQYLFYLGSGYLWLPMVLLAEIVQTFILADFCYYYVKSVVDGQLVMRLPPV